ncbi:hypothetical protein POM88_015517 [Heracleum sosnowskyi]|uniref:Glycosyltransferases n=1 Tax=Heracleum sosnowskyi TaxID=360622 RepID=A0AAD8IK25_9APIA|nr:hypothetical protein POM88_015517 [Heracleum sosnowskyi]
MADGSLGGKNQGLTAFPYRFLERSRQVEDGCNLAAAVSEIKEFIVVQASFIEQVVEDDSQMEGIPEDCSRIMNWHLHFEARDLVYPDGWLLQKNLEVVLPIN